MIPNRYKSLVSLAKTAQKMAYCPYSRYPVGAAVLTDSGRIFTGANVENASYGLSLCAERIAIFNAVTRGQKGLQAVCVAGKSARPCGACRQVMLEFSDKETALILVDIDHASNRESVTKTRVYSMLPSPFDPLDSGLIPRSPQNLLKGERRSRRRAVRKRLRRAAPRRARRPRGRKR